MNVFNYTLNPAYYLDSWIIKNNAESGRTSISTQLVNCFNEALQHYNKDKYKVTVSSLSYLDDAEGLSAKDLELRATMEKHKYWGLAPTIDWTCSGFSLLNGLAKVERGEGDFTQILSGYTYNNTNTGDNILTVEGVDDFFRYGTGSFSNPDIYEEHMTKRCLFAPTSQELVFHVELEPFYESMWFAGAGAYYATYDLDKDEYIEALNQDAIKEKYINKPDECLVIKSFWAYAKTGSSLPRSLINKTSYNKDKDTTPYVEFIDKFYKPLYVPVWGMLLDGCCPNYGPINNWTNNTPKLLFTPYLHKYGYFKERPLLRMKINTIGSNKPLDEHRFSFAIGTKAEFKKFFDDLGLKVTFNEDEAINVPVEEWEDVPVTPPVEPELPDLPDLIDPEIPDTPTRPNEGHANGNGGQAGGEVDNEIKPPVNPDSDTQEGGNITTGVKTASNSWALKQAEVTELNGMFLTAGLFDNIASWFLSPQDAVLSLIRFPFNIPDISPEYINTEDKTVVLGGVPLIHDKGVVTGRIMHHKFKTKIRIADFTIPEFFNSYLDYEPYSKIKMFLPYIGVLDLPVDYIVGKKIEVYYDIGYLDGSVMVIIQFSQEFGGHIITTISGSIGINVPVAKSSLQDNLMQLTKSTVGMAVGVAAGSVPTILNAPFTLPANRAQTMQSFKNSAYTNATDGVSNALSNVRQTTTQSDRPTSQHCRALPNHPYLIYERPKTNMTSNYTQIRGIATNIYKPLRELAGFTVCKDVKLDNLPRALASEVDEIRAILESGVIFGKPNKN